MIKTLGCGKIRAGTSDMRYLTVRNKKELHDIILPFFTKYNISSEKHKDFINFYVALVILYNNLGKGFDNLSQNNINELEHCINSMNKNRYNPISGFNDEDRRIAFMNFILLCPPLHTTTSLRLSS